MKRRECEPGMVVLDECMSRVRNVGENSSRLLSQRNVASAIAFAIIVIVLVPPYSCTTFLLPALLLYEPAQRLGHLFRNF